VQAEIHPLVRDSFADQEVLAKLYLDPEPAPARQIQGGFPVTLASHQPPTILASRGR